MAEYAILGKRMPREESVPKATGKAQYAIDVTMPGMLYGKVLTSPHAHAKILNIDTAKAIKLQGVKSIVTGKDLPEKRIVKPRVASLPGDIVGITKDKVRFIGDVVAAVAAIDEDTAEEALDLITVEYEILPALFDPEEAMKPGAIKIHDHSEQNIAVTSLYEYGDVEKGFKESDYVREDTFRFPVLAYCHPEPQNAVASYDPLTGKLTAWVAIQGVATLRANIANLLDLPFSKVRIIAPYVGGGFGGRLSGTAQTPFCAAALSLKSERPVQIVFAREQEFSSFYSATHQVIITVKTGVKKDGTLVAREATGIYDVGSYKDMIKGPTPQAYISGLHMPYKIPNVKLKGIAVYTNKQPIAAFRGMGQYQSIWSAELQMEMIAKELGIDPVAMRIANAVQPQSVTPMGWNIGSCGLTKCIQRVAETIEYKGQVGSLPEGHGKGIATSFFNSGGGGTPIRPLTALVRINGNGTSDLIVLGTDSGSGQYSALRMMVAEELGIPLKDVKRPISDTDLFSNEEVPQTVTITNYGGAVRKAAVKAREMLLEVVANKMEANAGDMVSREGRVYVKGSPDRGMSFAEAAKIAVTEKKGPLVGRGESFAEIYSRIGLEEVKDRYLRFSNVGTSMGFSFGAAGAEVEVDKETGKVKILRLAHAYDVGFAINPLEVEGQLQGGAAMSVGRLLTEEVIHDNGQVLNPSFLNYKMVTAKDMPKVIPIIVEEREDFTPYGVKELGMGAFGACGNAVGNAIYNAIGVMVKELPVTPERILKALEAKDKKKG